MKTCQVLVTKGFEAYKALCGKPAIASRVIDGERINVCLNHMKRIDGESK